MAFYILSLLQFSLFIILHPPPSATATATATAHQTRFRSELIAEPISPSNGAPFTTYFEVTKPIELPNSKPCSYLLLQQDFGFTYGKPPSLVEYKPPRDCPSGDFAKIVLEWKATVKGRQFDRIFGVWLGGVELLRSCTAEPRATGTVWTVKKDITRYRSLLMTNQTLAVYMGNLVDSTYTGVYHVNLSIHFYPAEANSNSHKGNLDDGADLILPISRNLPLNDGLWFEIQNSTHVETKQFKIPPNAYRAVLEVYVSFHENDEFWYTNVPDEYLLANNITNLPGNGAFREAVVSLDGVVAGAVWPFTVIYTGGVNPLLWRPITGIGSFDLPSYDIELTPFLGKILDGKMHKLSFGVTNALNVWYVDANLHLWLDHKSVKTEGLLLRHTTSPPVVSVVSNFTGLDGNFVTRARRSISSAGWVKSSFGKITTDATQEFNFSNVMVMGKDAELQIVNQMIDFNDTVSTKKEYSSGHHLIKSFKRFPLYLYSDTVNHDDGTYSLVTNLTLDFQEDRVKASGPEFIVSSLKNLQNGQGEMLVKGNLVVSGKGSTHQLYKYDSSKYCYSRDVASSNYTILHDKVGNNCSKKLLARMPLGLSEWWRFPARKALLGPDHHRGQKK